MFEHNASKEHKGTMASLDRCNQPIEKVISAAVRRCDDAALNLFRAAYLVGKVSLPFTTFPEMCKMLKQMTDKIPRGLYQDDKACAEMICCSSQVLQARVLDRVRASVFFGIMIDESTDVSTTGHLVVFCTFIENGQVKTAFLGLIHIPNKDAAAITAILINRLHEWNLDIKRFVGFGSDGAASMLGSKNGVAARLRRMLNPFLTVTHCVAHRTNLASLQAAKNTNCKRVSDEVDTILNSVSGYFSHSAKRKAALYSLQETLDDCRRSMKRYCKIRWLSRTAAVTTLCDSYESVLVFLRDKDDDVAKCLFGKLRDFRMLYIIYFLADILSSIASLSKIFQKSNVDVSAVGALVSTTCTEIEMNYLLETTDLNAKDRDEVTGYHYLPDFGLPGGYLRRLQSELRGSKQFHSVELLRSVDGNDLEAALKFQKDFAAALVEALQDRFQDNTLVSSFRIFNPREVPRSAMAMRDWGCKELERLCAFYGEDRTSEVLGVVPALVAPASIKGPDDASEILTDALTLWKNASEYRFLYSNPDVYL
ncbi:hypothetical protein R1sor_015841 [Riccia sorocarpa]|uniref:DUF4371 domain-containing protein n=1 Tax=Riccia sorocarpa TaxID=122646 RepID=A0ABD3HGG8_9MARC